MIDCNICKHKDCTECKHGELFERNNVSEPKKISVSNGKECCGNCKYHQYEDISQGWVCCNQDSEYVADWTDYTDSCEEWESR